MIGRAASRFNLTSVDFEGMESERYPVALGLSGVFSLGVLLDNSSVCILTFSGICFRPLDPRPDDIRILDISLRTTSPSNIPRNVRSTVRPAEHEFHYSKSPKYYDLLRRRRVFGLSSGRDDGIVSAENGRDSTLTLRIPE